MTDSSPLLTAHVRTPKLVYGARPPTRMSDVVAGWFDRVPPVLQDAVAWCRTEAQNRRDFKAVRAKLGTAGQR